MQNIMDMGMSPEEQKRRKLEEIIKASQTPNLDELQMDNLSQPSESQAPEAPAAFDLEKYNRAVQEGYEDDSRTAKMAYIAEGLGKIFSAGTGARPDSAFYERVAKSGNAGKLAEMARAVAMQNEKDRVENARYLEGKTRQEKMDKLQEEWRNREFEAGRSDKEHSKEMDQKRYDLELKKLLKENDNNKFEIKVAGNGKVYKLNKVTGDLIDTGTVMPVEPKPLTEAQSKDKLFGERMQQAEGDLEKLYSSGYNRASIGSGVEAKLPNVLQSKEAQMQMQAERNFLNAVLRRESGAVISAEEFANGAQQYFPRAGDSPETLAQKKRNRELATKNMLEAGKVIPIAPAENKAPKQETKKYGWE